MFVCDVVFYLKVRKIVFVSFFFVYGNDFDVFLEEILVIFVIVSGKVIWEVEFKVIELGILYVIV